MLTFKETGETGIIATIGINRNIRNLGIVTMEGRTLVMKLIRLVLIKDIVKATLAKTLHREKLIKAPRLPDKRTLVEVLQLDKERLRHVGMVLQIPKSIPQVKPLKANIRKKNKEADRDTATSIKVLDPLKAG
jgi:hypothetical protein